MDISNKLDAFASIGAPSPNDRKGWVTLEINAQRVQSLANHGQINKIFEMFYNVAGAVPPVDNIGYHEKKAGFPLNDHWGGVRHAHALFRGLKRPFNEQPNGADIYVYIVSPKFAYKYEPDMVCRAKRVSAPPKAIFVVYARFDRKFTHGEIVGWEWVFADSQRPELPDGFNERYDEPIW